MARRYICIRITTISQGEFNLSESPLNSSSDSHLREQLYQLLDESELTVDEKLRESLLLGCEYLAVDNAHIQRHQDDGTDEIVASVGDHPDLLPEGTVLDRSTTYCRRTVEQDSPLALSHASEQGWKDDPAYHEHGLECYLGTTISVEGEQYGTVCFTSPDPRDEFTGEEKLFVELMARVVGRILHTSARQRQLASERQAREESERKYEALLRAAPDAIVLVDAGTREIVDVNERTLELTDYSESDLLGTDILDLHPAADRDRYRQLFTEADDVTARSAFPDGTPLELERADGRTVPIELSVSVVELDGQRLRQGIMRDISDRREREESLERQRELFRTTQDMAQLGGWEVDFRSKDVSWTEGIYQIRDLQPDVEPEYDRMLEFYPPEDRETITDALDRLRDHGEPYDLELKQVTAEGELCWIRTMGQPRYEDGEIVGARGVIQDITDRKERERELRVKNRALDEASLGITIADATDPELPLVYANDEFERLTQYDEDRVLGENCRFLQGPGTDEETVDEIREALGANEPTTVEILNYRADGTPFWNELTLAPVTGEDHDSVTHFIGFQRDITDRKRRTRSLEIVDRAYRHNIRNGMSVISNFADVVARETSGTPAERARRIGQKARELTALNEKARTLEMVVRETVEPSVRDIVTDVESVVDDLRSAHPDTTFEIDAADSHDILGTPQIQTALRELGENAAKHTEAATVTFHVGECEDETVTVAVSDTGPGLSEQEIELVEEAKETQLRHGDGLGLWLVNWIVTEVGGSVSADADDGTTVSLQFPPAVVDAELPSSRYQQAAFGMSTDGSSF
jgi:PAS domain S-box-containing protein